jgi:DNA-3-methyladenine glycosylase
VHNLFNVVTGPAGSAHAVLIRAVEPLEGIDVMLARRNARAATPALTTGPGALGKAFGLNTHWTGQSFYLPGSPIWIEDRGFEVGEADIETGTRIGVEYAGECAQRPWRFWLRGSPYVKRVR